MKTCYKPTLKSFTQFFLGFSSYNHILKVKITKTQFQLIQSYKRIKMITKFQMMSANVLYDIDCVVGESERQDFKTQMRGFLWEMIAKWFMVIKHFH